MQRHVLVLLSVLLCRPLFADTGVGISAPGRLTSMPPDAPTLTAPAHEATDLALKVTLSWRKLIHCISYQVHVANNSDFSELLFSRAGVIDTSISIDGLKNNTKYHWRIQAKNAAGTGTFSQTRSFTTRVAAPGVPVLLSPEDAAINVALNTTLSWGHTDRAATYQLQISIQKEFTTLVMEKTDLPDTAFVPANLKNLTQYFWRVRAQNIGGLSDWSQANSFVTIMAAPTIPVLISPAPDSKEVDWNTNLIWSEAAGALTYDLQVAKQADFGLLILQRTGIAETSFAIKNLEPLTTYYWRVRSQNPGGFSEFTVPASFTTRVAAPGVPELLLPINNAVRIDPAAALSWRAIEQAKSYHLQIANDAEYSEMVVDQSDISDTLFIPTTLANNTLYYWRVRAANSSGYSEYSASWTFKTMPLALAAPILVYPVNDRVTTPLNVVLTWQSVERAAAYHIQVASDSGFNTLVLDKFDLTEPQFSSTALHHLRTYYWRVRATNQDGEGPYSTVWRFTTGSTGVAENESSGLPLTFTLLPNYPNPFNPETTIPFQIPAMMNQWVTLKIFNGQGQLVHCLFSGTLAGGSYSVKWNGKNQNGEPVGSGLYIGRLETEGKVRIVKILYLR